MATQVGPIFITGTIQQVTFYRRMGKHLARKKSNLTKERVKTDPAFSGSRQAAQRFANAARIAGELYRQLPPEKKRHGLIGKLTGHAGRLLLEGKDPALIKQCLLTEGLKF